MAKGISLHIGVKEVDPRAYPPGWDSRLRCPENDARDLAGVAAARGFGTMTLLTAEARAERVLLEITNASQELYEGDFFLLTFSGHGGQMPDAEGKERDRLDDTWVLYDRQLYDDEISRALLEFGPGVRILVMSDSCFSGTIIQDVHGDVGGAHRAMPADVARADLEARRSLYEVIRRRLPLKKELRQYFQAATILLSACREDQQSKEGPTNGVFTGLFLTTWDDGKFAGNYEDLHRSLEKQSPSWQTPQLEPDGPGVEEFLHQIPLTL